MLHCVPCRKVQPWPLVLILSSGGVGTPRPDRGTPWTGQGYSPPHMKTVELSTAQAVHLSWLLRTTVLYLSVGISLLPVRQQNKCHILPAPPGFRASRLRVHCFPQNFSSRLGGSVRYLSHHALPEIQGEKLQHVGSVQFHQ